MQKQINPQRTFAWAAGQQWFYQGLNLLKTLGGLWLMVLGMYGLAAIAVIQIDNSLFYIVLAVLSPLITAGIYHACYRAKKQEDGGRVVQFSDYMVSWQKQTKPLLTLGLVMLVFGIISESVTQFIFDGLGLVLEEGMPPVQIMKNALIAQVISTVVSIPMLVVALFSPQLVYFHKQSISQALKGSYKGFIHSWKALLMLSLMVMAMAFVVIMLGAIFSAFLSAVATVLMTGALVLIFSVNLCGQFFAFDAVFPIDNDDAEVENHAEAFHTEI